MNCFKCNAEMVPITGDGDQPNDGLMFWTHGTYGSTVFDPMDGTYLLIIICDDCIVRHAKDDRVKVERDRRPVEIEGHGICGWERVDNPLIPWHKGLPGFSEDDCVRFDSVEEALEFENARRIEWSCRPSVILKEEAK